MNASWMLIFGLCVALRKESEDRNLYYGDGLTFADGSLSARRAWIEISGAHNACQQALVALRKESVDRNTMTTTICIALKRSLSARRAWIEIS